MNITPEELARIQRVTMTLARPHRFEVECPCGVWDSEDVGVIIRKMKKGEGEYRDRRYMVSSSFSLDAQERKSEESIRLKAKIAIDALVHHVMTNIKEVKRKPVSVPE